MLVVPFHNSWKLPVAYFLVHGLTADIKVNLIRETLRRLYDVGVEVASLTLDGPADHISTVKKL